MQQLMHQEQPPPGDPLPLSRLRISLPQPGAADQLTAVVAAAGGKPLPLIPPCQCQRFLHPFLSNGTSPPLPGLPHYCLVCNIQLNSCRQAKIHSEGKKHYKRVHCLKLCMESNNPPGSLLSAQSVSDLAMTPSSSGSTGLPSLISGQAIQNAIQATSPSHNNAPGLLPNPVLPPPARSAPGAQSLFGPAPVITNSASYPVPHQPQQVVPLVQNPDQSAQSVAPQYMYHPQVPPASVQPVPLMSAQANPPGAVSSCATSMGLYSNAMQQQPVMSQQPPLNYPGYPPQQHQQQYQSFYPDQSQQLVHGNPMPQPHPMFGVPPPTHQGHCYNMQQQHQMQQHQMQPQQRQFSEQHLNMMSPSLTSGFGGSIGDCKSTETSSILSAASYSSSLNNHNSFKPHRQAGKYERSYTTHSGYTGESNCNSYAMPSNKGRFRTSASNVHHHQQQSLPPQATLQRSRSTSQQVLPTSAANAMGYASSTSASQYNSSSGPYRKHGQGKRPGNQHSNGGDLESGAEIRCEVCSVSVNSSHQLQAHLTGQKHRVRAIRRGLKTDQANVSPSSSTLTSSASESEKGFPTNSSLNLVRESSSSARRSSAANLLASSLGVAGSTRNRSLTFGGVRSVLSRHLSSSCLTNKQMHYRSTSSLRKAISSTTLSKSRSMNLLICDPLSANRRLHAQQSSGAWSYESEDESTSISDNDEDDHEQESLLDEHVIHVHERDEEEDEDENLSRSESSDHLGGLAKGQDQNGSGVQASPDGPSPNSAKCKGNKVHKTKKRNLLWIQQQQQQKQHIGNGAGGKHSSLKEIPMLNMFLQRLNSHQSPATATATTTVGESASSASRSGKGEGISRTTRFATSTSAAAKSVSSKLLRNGGGNGDGRSGTVRKEAANGNSGVAAEMASQGVAER